MPGLTRIPLDLSVEWVSKTVTTDPPRLIPHEEWRLSLDIAAVAPINVAVLLYAEDEVTWGTWQYEASDRVQIPVHFLAYDSPTSDEMQFAIGWRRIRLSDAELKIDPRGQTTVLLPSSARTGEIIPVCKLRSHPITAAVFTVAGQDVEPRRRDRWRVRPELTDALPPS